MTLSGEQPISSSHDEREERISALIQFWLSRRGQGELLSAEELCRACPELTEDVRRRLETNPGRGTETSSALTLPEKVSLDNLEESGWPQFDGYAVEGILGHGGMGIVFKARQLFPDRPVAVKMLRSAALPEEDEARRFLTEIQSLARLNHPNIVPVHGAGQYLGRPWYSMEYLPGRSLAHQLKDGPMGIREAAALAEKLARAIQAAHEAGIIHRDLKPANILLAADGTPKIADFGLARQMHEDQELTRSGTILGTPCYMAPEQASGQGSSPRSDVYSLGVILFELLAGRLPFRGATPADTISDVIGMPPPPPRRFNPRVPKELEAVCLKCLEKKPEDRYESALAFAEDLARWQRGEPTLARPAGAAARAWRAARSHPGICLLVLLLFGVLGTLLALFLNDPKRRLAKGLRDLKKGQPVVWIDGTGPPLWFRDEAGQRDTVLSTDRDAPFSVTTPSTALVELVPEMPLERYRIKARIRQTDTAFLGMAGLYLGRIRFGTPTGGEHYFLELSFTDSLPHGERLPPGLHLRRWSETPPAENAHPRLSWLRANSEALPPDRTEAVWHDLTVEVTPETIKIWEDNRVYGEVKTARREKDAGIWLRTNGHAGAAYPNTTTGAGLGLYVHRGTAQFQFLTISPLDGP